MINVTILYVRGELVNKQFDAYTPNLITILNSFYCVENETFKAIKVLKNKKALNQGLFIYSFDDKLFLF